MDAEDLRLAFDLMQQAGWENRIEDVSYDFSFSIDEVVVLLEKVMERTALTTQVNKGSGYDLHHQPFVQLCKDHDQHPEKMAYLEGCLRKYLG